MKPKLNLTSGYGGQVTAGSMPSRNYTARSSGISLTSNTIRLGMSNARIEATNNKIKLIIRKAYDFRNIQNMLDMVYLVCSDLTIPLPNRKPKAVHA